MGRRSINTTKSGKYMNPTDQARKEARKKELKKNKKQRMLVRTAVLKGKDPLKLLDEMEIIDQMEFNPIEAPKLNEKVLKDKRKKLRETFTRVFRLYEKENPEYAKELRKADNEYEKKRERLQTYYEQVKNAERVQLNEIPLPDLPVETNTVPAMIPLPGDIPLPSMQVKPHGILKKTSAYSEPVPEEPPVEEKKKKPPGPPPGPPPELSDSEDEEYDPAKGVEEIIGTVEGVTHPHDEEEPMDEDILPKEPPPSKEKSKKKKIRFIDDDTRDPEEAEKDTRLKFAKPKPPPVTSLQKRMLEMAGQDVPKRDEAESDEDRDRDRDRDRDIDRDRDDRGSSSSSDSEDDEEYERRRRRRDSSSSESDDDEEEEETFASHRDEDSEEEQQDVDERIGKEPPQKLVPPGAPERGPLPPGPPPGAPPGLPPGLPPGPPPGAPPMMVRPPPPLRGGPPGPHRMMPPGPPPGRPHGMPPGPPPGLPPNIRLPPRLPPGGPPGMPPPRMMRPPGGPPGVMPPGVPPPPGVAPAPQNPNVLSAPPSIMKPPQKAAEEKKDTATITAKPQIKNVLGDVTRFTPTTLKVKREPKDARLKKASKEEEKKAVGITPKPAAVAQPQTKRKDDAYDQFMKEMENLL